MNKKLFDFISVSPTAYHTVENVVSLLDKNGYLPLVEGKKWNVERGRGYYVTRNGSSAIAFKVPKARDFDGFMICASHSDSPSLKIKDNAVLEDRHYIRLSTERYGGLINSTWLDRPLSIAGRVIVKNESGVTARLVDLKEPVAVIPNVAVHLDRNTNDGKKLDASVDMIPLYSDNIEGRVPFIKRIAENAKVDEKDILSFDLMLYNAEAPTLWGDYISSPRLDDLQCVYATLEGFINSDGGNGVPVLAVFDNEEVGSHTKQGADSTFLRDVLIKLTYSLGLNEPDYIDKIAQSLMISCDNAQGVHPNHPELSDKNAQVTLNGGIVLKHNANQSYSTDGISAAFVKLLCDRAEIPCQDYSNRADIPGGSTLGNISNTQVSMMTADIGLAQLAMHSAYETAGAIDTEYLVKLSKEFYKSSVKINSDGDYELK